jgi:hypothetical protein
MIYITTFFLTLLLSHIARAAPACDDVATREEQYDALYADALYAEAQAAEHATLKVYNVTWSSYYDNPKGDTKKVACGYLAPQYPHFKNFPDYSYIGGVYNIKKPSHNGCNECWKLTYGTKIKKHIYIRGIDSDKNHGFNISHTAYKALTGGSSKTVLAEAAPAAPSYCAHKPN